MARRARPHPLIAALAAAGFPAGSDAVDDVRFAVAQTGTTVSMADLMDEARHRSGVRYADRVRACADLLALRPPADPEVAAAAADGAAAASRAGRAREAARRLVGVAGDTDGVAQAATGSGGR